MYRTSIRKISVVFLFQVLLLGAIPIDAQKKQAGKGSSGSWGPPKTQGCQGGWRGVVRIRKTLNDSLTSDEPGIRKDIDRIKHVDSRKYTYVGTAIIDGWIRKIRQSGPRLPSRTMTKNGARSGFLTHVIPARTAIGSSSKAPTTE